MGRPFTPWWRPEVLLVLFATGALTSGQGHFWGSQLCPSVFSSLFLVLLLPLGSRQGPPSPFLLPQASRRTPRPWPELVPSSPLFSPGRTQGRPVGPGQGLRGSRLLTDTKAVA